MTQTLRSSNYSDWTNYKFGKNAYHHYSCVLWSCYIKSSNLWSSQIWMQCMQLRIEAWKIQDFNRVSLWTRDLVILVQCSNQLSYEATDVGSCSFVGSNEPVRNVRMWNDIWNISYIGLWMWNQVSYDETPVECVQTPVSRFKPCWSPEFFRRLLYAIA